MSLHVLVVDDERISRLTTTRQLQAAGYVAEPAENAYAALERLGATAWDVVITDLRMPGLDGLEFLREAKQRFPGVEIIVMTAYGAVETAVTAMQQGAADYLTKPFSFSELDFRLRRIQQLRESQSELSRLRALVGELDSSSGLLGRSTAMGRVRERIRLFAASAAPVLVTGETGTGKELVARAIHELGPRKGRPFVAVACGAIPRELAESELFGHEKGAFTGAVARHRGSFERASGGTFLLDDVDDLPLDIQVKLLRVLQEGVVRRVGSDEDLAVDVRVVATTKVCLEKAVEERRFREDLFYRLRGLEIALPALRDRGDDVLILAQHFLRVLASRTAAEPKHVAPEAAALLQRHPWPGNVRELWRVIESSVVLCPGSEIGPAHLPDFLAADRQPVRLYSLALENQSNVQLAELMAEFEADVIQWALRQASGHQARAAEILGIPRTTLQSKLARPKG